ncbi:MAG: DegV family protein [Actinomycetota bacterium]|nr:DegV family protein [Actinomycetota bacterium]
MRLSAENTALVLDSTADLPHPEKRHPNWKLVPLYVRFGEDVFRDHAELTAADFYRRLRAGGPPPHTSQPTPADFAAAFEALVDYERVVCVLISSKLSGTYESAALAAASLGPERIILIDSASASGGMVILADALQRRLARGTSEEELLALAQRFRRESGLLFTVDTLDYLVRGGRVGRAAGLAGELLSVKPILAIREGEVVPVKRVRGRAKALAEFERLFAAGAADSPALHIGVAHADAESEAAALVERLRATRPRASVDFFGTLGPVVGTHAGPGTLGLFWFEDAV